MDRPKYLEINEICEIIMNPESGDESDFELDNSEIVHNVNNIGAADGELISNNDISLGSESSPNMNEGIDDEEKYNPSLPYKDKLKYGPQNLYEWRKVKLNKFEPRLFDFDASKSGINNVNMALNENCTESDCFKALFDKDLVDLIVEETNRYCEQYKQSVFVKPHSKVNKWHDTCASEMYSFLAICMLMGHNKKSKLFEFWSTDPLLESPIFRRTFSLDRFCLLLRMLHFSNNENQIPGDRLHKITTVLHSLKLKFRQAFTPFQNLCIKESMLQWEGRLSFSQYLPKKRHRFGIKLFHLCDCKTGFILNFTLYTRTQSVVKTQNNLDISGSIVKTLLEPYFDLGHKIFVDDWYSSPYLFQFLFENKTGAVGTVRLNGQNMPKFSKLQPGEYQSQATTSILVEKWVERKNVNMISTTHKNELKKSNEISRVTGEPIVKPASLIDYNMNTGLVSKSDFQISFTENARKTTKWYKKMFFYLMDLSTFNSYILYKLKTGKNNLQLSKFRLSLIKQLLEDYTLPRPFSGGRRSKEPLPMRLTARHFPEFIPATGKKERPRRKCFVCKSTTIRAQKRKETPWMCKECDIPLCVPECFRTYHTSKTF